MCIVCLDIEPMSQWRPCSEELKISVSIAFMFLLWVPSSLGYLAIQQASWHRSPVNPVFHRIYPKMVASAAMWLDLMLEELEPRLLTQWQLWDTWLAINFFSLVSKTDSPDFFLFPSLMSAIKEQSTRWTVISACYCDAVIWGTIMNSIFLTQLWSFPFIIIFY
jgi:hypothetical protein